MAFAHPPGRTLCRRGELALLTLKLGSGNIGATNAAAIRIEAACPPSLRLDIGKGAAAAIHWATAKSSPRCSRSIFAYGKSRKLARFSCRGKGVADDAWRVSHAAGSRRSHRQASSSTVDWRVSRCRAFLPLILSPCRALSRIRNGTRFPRFSPSAIPRLPPSPFDIIGQVMIDLAAPKSCWPVWNPKRTNGRRHAIRRVLRAWSPVLLPEIPSRENLRWATSMPRTRFRLEVKRARTCDDGRRAVSANTRRGP